jgi:cobalt-zinc-cadmium efflux system outer membrane protein
MNTFFRFIAFTLILPVSYSAHAQDAGRDSIRLTLNQADELFLKNNFQLVLKQYDIDRAKAAIITARLFDNPQLSIENVLYNPDTHKVFDMSHNGGQYQAQVSQLFRLAGKRNKNIQLAKAGAKLPEYEFADLLRTLRYSLHDDFYKIYFQQRSITVYDKEIVSLKDILHVFEQQYSKGNISEKEVLRIKSLLYTLQAEQSELYNHLEDVQTDLKLIISANAGQFIIPTMDTTFKNEQYVNSVPYQQLLDSAIANRNDLKQAVAAIGYANMDLSVQKSNAVPDLTVSATYDKQGSFIRNYSGLGVALPLQLFNRNQGGIKQARINIDASNIAAKNQQLVVENEVSNSYRTALRVEKLYGDIDPKFGSDFNHLIDEVNKNYQKRNISLLKFLDFYDSYKVNSIQLNNLNLGRISSREEINYVTATPFFN